MTQILWIAQLLMTLASLVAAPVLVLLALPFARQDPVNILPSWLQWLNTPDDTGGNQGMYEPQIASVYNALGWHFKTWYWLGIRNTFGGVWKALAHPGEKMNAEMPQTKNPYRPGVKIIRRGNLWEFGAVWSITSTKCQQIRAGWRINDGSGSFLFQVCPWITKDSTS